MISWHQKAWDDYLYWQQNDKRVLKRVNALIRDIERSPFDGIGKPEQLKHEWSGFWSRRINLFISRSALQMSQVFTALY
uniref:Putative mRNA interferase YoeB n=1 Tax=Candidatus Kentrum sp. FW TaxID=2126338 RepID=A0A450T3S6_9GAMM|nr:MAG: toxin YoeB [Candidatus Kentron sp. FW]VFJ61255.1 MAG: toxin YoeB [Candidatus Kentron sp. FW]